MSWVTLEVGNNWGDLFYTYPGEKLNANGINDTDNALQLHEGMQIAVRFPDDWGQVVELVSKRQTFSYGDMGQTHTGTTLRWGFEVEVHGLKVWIPLESVQVPQDFARRRKERDAAVGAKPVDV